MIQESTLSPRFEPRFVNGVHVVFDTLWYGHDVAYLYRKLAEDAAWRMNRKELAKGNKS